MVNSLGSVLTFRDCLLVPGLKANLFSIPSATKKGVHAVFTDNIVQFFRDDTWEMESSREQAQLYHLDVTVTVQHETLHALVSRAAPIQVWHERFGHLSCKTIEKMVRNNSVKNLTVKGSAAPKWCVGCIKVKMHVLPFEEWREIATEIGYLFYSILF